jgi:MFS family permease
LGDLWRAVKRRQTNYLAVVAGCASTNILVFGALWGVPFAMERFAASRPVAAGAVSLMLLGFAIGAPVWGAISDRLARRKAPLLVGLLVAGASVCAAIYLPLSFLAFQALLFLAGFGAGCMAVTYAAAREHNPGAATGGALGYINMTSVIAGAVLQPIVGLFLDWQWDGRLVEGARRYTVEAYRLSFAVLPAVYLVGFSFAFCVRETWCKSVETRA